MKNCDAATTAIAYAPTQQHYNINIEHSTYFKFTKKKLIIVLINSTEVCKHIYNS